MPFSVDTFRTSMALDGARPNLFEVYIPVLGQDVTFKCKAAELPGSSIGVVPVQYFGREIKFAGNRTFDNWTVTVINDEDFNIRNQIEAWMNNINDHTNNVRTIGTGPANYTADATVFQYNKDGTSTKAYTFVGMFPTTLAPIALDWGTNDTIEEYQITFAYQYWLTNTTPAAGAPAGASITGAGTGGVAGAAATVAGVAGAVRTIAGAVGTIAKTIGI